MSALVKRLVDQLEARGLTVGPGPEPGQLVLHGPAAERTPEVMAALKAFKPDLLKLYAPREAETPGEPGGGDAEGERVPRRT